MNVTILAEQISDSALRAVLPSGGVGSVQIRRADPSRETPAGPRVRSYPFRHPSRFSPTVRVDLVVDAAAAERIVDGVSFAHGAGFFGAAEVLIEAPGVAA